MALIYDISQPFPLEFEYRNRRYRMTLFFNRVISFFALFENNSAITNEERFEIGFEWLVKPLFKGVLTTAEKAQILQYVIDTYINFRKNAADDSQTVLNFSQDSLYIYGSFMDAYGIDLFEEQNNLHWWKFIALFEALPDESKIKQVMSIRAREIPKPDGHNQELIRQIMEQKRCYALEIPQEQLKKRANDSLNRLFDILLAKAGD